MNPTIFIADDHPILLKGLQDLLKEKHLKVVSTATDGRTALNYILKNEPDIAILDIEMPYLTGIEIASQCKKHSLKTKIILLTLHKEADLFFKAKSLNISGYLLKEFALEEIETCIKSVKFGEPYFSEKIKDLIGFSNENKTILNELTASEIRVLKLVVKQHTTKEIARLLFISPRTVEKHRSKIIAKLNLSSGTNSLLLWSQKNKHLFV